MSFKSFLKSNFSCTGYFKALFCAGVGFNLWHYTKFYFYTLLASRTDGNLWSLVGNMFFIPSFGKHKHKCLMGCKCSGIQQIYQAKMRTFKDILPVLFFFPVSTGEKFLDPMHIAGYRTLHFVRPVI